MKNWNLFRNWNNENFSLIYYASNEKQKWIRDFNLNSLNYYFIQTTNIYNYFHIILPHYLLHKLKAIFLYLLDFDKLDSKALQVLNELISYYNNLNLINDERKIDYLGTWKNNISFVCHKISSSKFRIFFAIKIIFIMTKLII